VPRRGAKNRAQTARFDVGSPQKPTIVEFRLSMTHRVFQLAIWFKAKKSFDPAASQATARDICFQR
jgi:hypothetical protein